MHKPTMAEQQLLAQQQYLYGKLPLIQSQQRKAILEKLPETVRKAFISRWRLKLIKGDKSLQTHRLTRVVRYLLQVFEGSNYLKDLNAAEVSGISALILSKEQQAIHIVDMLYLDRGVSTLRGIGIFRALLITFQHLSNEELRQMTAENLVEMLRQDKALIPLAGHPYYFLEYLLHLINQEEQSARIIYWFQALRDLYLAPGAEAALFHQTDFRLMIDVLVRHIENFPTQQQIIPLLQTYLVFSISPYLRPQGRYYKLEQIIVALNDIPHPSQALSGYKLQIQSLLQEQQ